MSLDEKRDERKNRTVEGHKTVTRQYNSILTDKVGPINTANDASIVNASSPWVHIFEELRAYVHNFPIWIVIIHNL